MGNAFTTAMEEGLKIFQINFRVHIDQMEPKVNVEDDWPPKVQRITFPFWNNVFNLFLSVGMIVLASYVLVERPPYGVKNEFFLLSVTFIIPCSIILITTVRRFLLQREIMCDMGTISLTTNIKGEDNFEEPTKNYTGVYFGKEEETFEFLLQLPVTRTFYQVILEHEDTDKNIQLFKSSNQDLAYDVWEKTCANLNLPKLNYYRDMNG
jgi:hypothetical protein